MELLTQIEFCTSKYSDKRFCFSRQHFTRAALNSQETATVGEAGQKQARASDRASAVSSPSALAHW